MSTDLLSFTTARRTSRATQLNTWLATGTLNIYGTPRPADADTAVGAAVLLATLTFSSPAGTVSTGTWTADPLPQPGLILATGSALWARLRDSAGVTIADVEVGVTGSGTAVTLAALSLVAGGLVTVSSCAIIEG